MNKILIFCTLILGFGCVGGGEKTIVLPASTGSSSPSSSSSLAKWSTANPNITLKIANGASGFSAGEITLIQTMADSWETAANNSNFFSYGTDTNIDSSNLDDYYNDSDLGVYKSTLWFSPSEVSATALAVTQYFGYRSGDYLILTHADIIFNFSGTFTFNTTNPTPAGEFDLPSVAIHELGHFLGLGHNTSDSTSVMKSTVASGPSSFKRTLAASDTTNIKTRYGLAGGGALTASDNPNALTAEQGQLVRGIVEVNADGTCIHRENGKVIHSHSVKVRK
jgi:hypothetical protein